MTRVALDSNILIYAELEPDSEKGTPSTDLILRAARDGAIPVQVLGSICGSSNAVWPRCSSQRSGRSPFIKLSS